MIITIFNNNNYNNYDNNYSIIFVILILLLLLYMETKIFNPAMVSYNNANPIANFFACILI